MTAPDITIPPEALEAAASELYEQERDLGWRSLPSWSNAGRKTKERHYKAAHAACLAMLGAWQTEKHKMIVGVAIDEVGGQCPAIILPLPQKETSE